MQITNKLLADFTKEIMALDKGARLTEKWLPWQTESSMRPLHQLLQDSLDKGTDLRWKVVEQVIAQIPRDRRTKYKKALDVIEQRKDKWDFLANRVSGFGKFSAFDYEANINIPGRAGTLLVRGEGLNPGEMQEITENLRKLFPVLHQLASNDKLGNRREWFAQASLGEVATALDNFDKYLNLRCTTLTFKRLHVGMRCDSDVDDPDDLVRPSLAGQVIPTVMLKGEDRPDFRKPGAYVGVPSGLRVFFGPLYFSVRNNYDAILNTVPIYRFMTLVHELSHKIIKTTDVDYELDKCRAIKDTPDGVKCADSWGYFITQYAYTPQAHLRSAMQARRVMMGGDDDD